MRRVDTDGQGTPEVRACATPDEAFFTVSAWLTEPQCPVVALESTGVSWRPVSHVLVGPGEGLVGQAPEMRRRLAHQPDKAEARWMAELWAHGLRRPSVIPPPPSGALRALTRPRVAVIQARTPANNRVVNVREETQIKRTRVVSALFGRRGRRRLAALLAGERAPQTLAALALGVLRRQLPPLALTGPLTDPHAGLMQGALERIDRLDRQLADLDQPIGARMAPLAPQREQRTSLPGIEATAARAILAAIGTERRHVGSAARLAAWAGVCPGHDERAGKRRSGRTRTGHRDRRRVLVPGAWAARTTPTVPGHTCRRLEGRLGGKKAAMAVAHTILGMGSYLLLEGTCDEEARAYRRQDRPEEHQQKRAVKALERLGSRVSLARLASR